MENSTRPLSAWERFATVARGGQADRVPVAFIVDSPWLPGLAGIDTLDYFLRTDEWLRIHLYLLERFPEVAWVPGFWVEYGMAIEPSALGARVVWHHDRPPSIDALSGGMDALLRIDPPDPQKHGLMPLALQRYLDFENRMLPQGMNVKMVAARGPLAIASWLLGVTDLLIALKIEPEKSHRMLDMLTTMIVNWLRAQIDVLRAPEGILLLDDIMGMLSPKMFEQFVRPYYGRIFDEFKSYIRVLHNDTPCVHLLEPLSTLGLDVFNFSHETDIALVQSKMPHTALMGNIPPLDIMVRGTPVLAEQWARECVRKTDGRNLILSAGGGVNGGTTPEMIDAIARATEPLHA
jgi:uroporphyrinogen decarboxylase